jgi:hypothetical protein
LERTGIPSISIGGILLLVCISGAAEELVIAS